MIKQKFRKKPVVIEAYQTDKELEIETLEGTMHASIGDWIITGVNGEPYPCKPDIFKKTYEPVVEVKDVAATTMTRQEAVKELEKISWSDRGMEAIYMAIDVLEQEPIIHCKDCKHWHEWENGTGSCHRSDIMWVGSDYCDYCSFAEKRESDGE